ncbi:hypothetical protein NHX12_031990, partial [Muraenolepis orangiensis]
EVSVHSEPLLRQPLYCRGFWECGGGSTERRGRHVVPGATDEMKSLIIEKNKMGLEDDPELLVKGWLLREVRGSWIKQRRYWFVLSQDSLDYYSGPEKGAKRLGTLVLTNLCCVIWPDKQSFKETGYWSLTVYGRKHCYRLYTRHFNEAVHWACALQKVIDTKATENKFDPEVVEHIYEHNPILRYTQGPLYAPLLAFPYGSAEHKYYSGMGYRPVREEAVKLFHCLQQLESSRQPVPIIQGVLQTCLDLRPLRDELYCQLAKQTCRPPQPHTAAHLRYWQLLACMSCTFLPSPVVLKYLRFHLKRIQSQAPESEMDNYASFVAEALDKTKCRESVPSWEEIQMLMGRQEMLCTVHYPGSGSCQLYVSSHTTANEVLRRMQEQLGLQESKNTFALYEQSALWEQPVAGGALIADILTSVRPLMGSRLFANSRFGPRTAGPSLSNKASSSTSTSSSEGEERETPSQWRLCFKLYCLLDADGITVDSIEYLFLFEQCHEMVVRGQLPACEEDLQALAALRLQCVVGDFSGHAPCPPLDQLFPGHVVEARSSTGSFSQKLWLGVAATSVSLYRQGETEALESLPYGQICSYGVSDSHTFKITAGDRDLLFETSKVDHGTCLNQRLPFKGFSGPEHLVE